MAFGTPVAGAVAYSASGGTSVSPAYPTGVALNDCVIMFVGQKPSTANGGTVTTPAGWTLLYANTAQGNYGTTLGADTGNTNLYAFIKTTVTGTETGNVAVTLGTNGVAWAFITRIPSTVGTFGIGTEWGAIGGSPSAGVESGYVLNPTTTTMYPRTGDLLIGALCIPTDVTTPSQFTNTHFAASNTTMNTAVELNEPDSATGSDIGGVSAWQTVQSGNANGFVSLFYITPAGTTTNVRGPIIAVRVREAPAPEKYLNVGSGGQIFNNFFGNKFYTHRIAFSKSLFQDIGFTNDNTIKSAVISQTGGVQFLTVAKYTNVNTFFAAVVKGVAPLLPSLYTNDNTIPSPVIQNKNELLPNLLVNTNFLAAPTVKNKNNLEPTKVTNTSVFYAADVAAPGAEHVILPPKYNNSSTFYNAAVYSTYGIYPSTYTNISYTYTPTVANVTTLRPELYVNSNSVYAAQVKNLNTIAPPRIANASVFYAPVVRSVWTLAPSRLVNTNTIYTPAVGQVLHAGIFTNANTFRSPVVTASVTLLPTKYTNTNSFYDQLVTTGWVVRPPKYTNTSTIYAPVVATSAWIISPPLIASANAFYPAVARSVRTLAPDLHTNTSAVYGPTVGRGAVNLSPPLYVNTNTFWTASILGALDLRPPLVSNTSQTYQAAVKATNTVSPQRVENQSVIHPAAATLVYKLTVGSYVDDGYVAGGYVGLNLQNVSQFPAAKVSYGLSAQRHINQATFFAHVLQASYELRPERLNNINQIFSPAATIGAAIIRPDVLVNQTAFYSPLVRGGIATIAPQRYINPQTFYPLVLTAPGVASQGSMIMMF